MDIHPLVPDVWPGSDLRGSAALNRGKSTGRSHERRPAAPASGMKVDERRSAEDVTTAGNFHDIRRSESHEWVVYPERRGCGLSADAKRIPVQIPSAAWPFHRKGDAAAQKEEEERRGSEMRRPILWRPRCAGERRVAPAQAPATFEPLMPNAKVKRVVWAVGRKLMEAGGVAVIPDMQRARSPVIENPGRLHPTAP